MVKYRVKTPIEMGKRYEPGDVIELSAREARAMPWAIEPYVEEAGPSPADAPAPGPEEKGKSEMKPEG